MGKLGNIAGLFSDVKTRSIVIFTTVLLAVGVGVGITGLKSNTATPGEAAKTTAVPRSIQNVPGAGQATAQYEALQLERNRELLEGARKSGNSAIPTLTGGFEKVELQPETPATPETPQSAVQERVKQQQEAMQARMAVDKAKHDSDVRMQEQTQFENETREALNKSLGKQAKTLLTVWAKPSAQDYVIGNAAKEQSKNNTASSGNIGRGFQGRTAFPSGNRGLGGGLGSSNENLAKAGDMIFAVLNTAIVSDDNGPVMATVVSGKMAGSKILGHYTMTNDKQRIILKFNQLNMAKAQKSFSINAVAINPFNGRTGLASDVDNHYLKRYGSLIAASLLQGYGEAVKDGGREVEDTPAGGRKETTPEKSKSDQLLIALGKVGTTLGSKVDKAFDTPPTVEVKEGIGLGILFLADVAAPSADL